MSVNGGDRMEDGGYSAYVQCAELFIFNRKFPFPASNECIENKEIPESKFKSAFVVCRYI